MLELRTRLPQDVQNLSDLVDKEEALRELSKQALKRIFDEYGEALKGTPEGKYLDYLNEHYCAGGPVIDEKLDRYEFPTKVGKIAEKSGWKYVGELFRFSRRELLTLDNVGGTTLDAIEKPFKEHDLKLGDIDEYVAPPYRSKPASLEEPVKAEGFRIPPEYEKKLSLENDTMRLGDLILLSEDVQVRLWGAGPKKILRVYIESRGHAMDEEIEWKGYTRQSIYEEHQ